MQGRSPTSPGGGHAEFGRRPRGERLFRIGAWLWLAATIGICASTAMGAAATWIALFAGLAVALPWLAFTIWALVIARQRALRGAYKSAMSAAFVPLIAVVATLYGREAADYGRFRLERANYLGALAAARAGHSDDRIDVGPPLFAYFTWGGMIWTSKGVAFDETDEAGKPDTERSEVWRARHRESEFSCEPIVRPLGGHFYMVHANC